MKKTFYLTVFPGVLASLIFSVCVSQAQIRLPSRQVSVTSSAWTNIAPEARSLAETLDWVDSHWVRPVAGQVSAQSFGAPSHATLAAAVSAIGTNPAVLVVDGGRWEVGTGNQTIVFPANIALEMAPGSWFDDKYMQFVSAWHVFGNTNLATLPGGAIRGLSYARPEWWGGFPDDTAPDTVAIRAALIASKNVELSRGTYLVGSLGNVKRLWHGIVLAPALDESFRFRLYGQGHDKTTLRIDPDLSAQGFSSADGGDTVKLHLLQVRPPLWYSTTMPHTNHWDVGGEIHGIHFDAGFDAVQGPGYPNSTFNKMTHNHLSLFGDGYVVRDSKFTQFGPGSNPSVAEAFPVRFGAPNTTLFRDSVFENNLITDSHSPQFYTAAQHTMGLQFVSGVSGFLWDPSIIPDHFPGTVHNGVFRGTDTASRGIITAATPESPVRLHVRNNVFRGLPVHTFLDDRPSFYGLVAPTRGIVEGNVVVDSPGAQFVNLDTYRIRDLKVRNNTLLGVRSGVQLVGSQYAGVFRNVEIHDNYIQLRNTRSGAHSDPFYLGYTAAPGSWVALTNYPGLTPHFQDIRVRDNFVASAGSYTGAAAPGMRIKHDWYANFASSPDINTNHYAASLFSNIEYIDNRFFSNEGSSLSPYIEFPTLASANYAGLPLAVRQGTWLYTAGNRNHPGVNTPRYSTFAHFASDLGGVDGIYRLRDQSRMAAQAGTAARSGGPLAFNATLLAACGGFGFTNHWMNFVAPGDDVVSGATYQQVVWTSGSPVPVSGRAMLKGTVTHSGNANRLAAARPVLSTSRDLSHLAGNGESFTVGAFLYVTEAGLYGRISVYDDTPGNTVSTPPIPLEPNRWNYVSVRWAPTALPFKPVPQIRIVTRQSIFDAYSIPAAPAPNGTEFYVDNVFIARGRLEPPEYIHLDSAAALTATSLSTLVPLFIGERVYDLTNERWKRAAALTAGAWKE